MKHIKLFEEFVNENVQVKNGSTYILDIKANYRNYSNSYQKDLLIKDHAHFDVKQPEFIPKNQTPAQFRESTGINLDKLKYFKPEFFLNEITIIKHNKTTSKITGSGVLLTKRPDGVNPAARSAIGYVETEGTVTGIIDNFYLRMFLERVSSYVNE